MTRQEEKNQQREKIAEAIKASLQLLNDGQINLIWWICRELLKL